MEGDDPAQGQEETEDEPSTSMPHAVTAQVGTLLKLNLQLKMFKKMYP